MATYISDADILSYLAVVLLKNTNTAELPSGAATGVTIANSRAYQDILVVLQQRGFLKSQIDLWDRAIEFNRDLAVYWLLTDSLNTESEGGDWVKQYDRRKELTTVSFVVAGQLQDGQAGTRRVGFGPMNTTGDIFTMDTRW